MKKCHTNRSFKRQGTQLFLPVLISDDSWTKLPVPWRCRFSWTFGASIYACPSEHFDVPYYAATKKFGSMELVFLNTCNKNWTNKHLGGVENASELPEQVPHYFLTQEQLNKMSWFWGNWSFGAYDNLLPLHQKLKNVTQTCMLWIKDFPLWANTGLIAADPDFQRLTSFSGFPLCFLHWVNKFQAVFTGGLSSLLAANPKSLCKRAGFVLYCCQ